MKCELCRKAEASQVLFRNGNEDDELYVCAACAKAEKLKRNNNRTRNTADSEEFSEEPPQIIKDFVDAVKDLVGDIEMTVHEVQISREIKPTEAEMPASRAPAAFRVRDGFHLEGLHLIGELDAVKRALHAVDMDIVGVQADGVNEAGHVYRFIYRGAQEQAKRVISDLLREEKNARVRLREEMFRIFADSVCRALAILKNCRLLSSGELFDLLSPLRLAAKEKLLSGITLVQIERMMMQQDLSNSEDRLSQPERDQVDAERADEANRRFEEVMLNDVF